MLAPAPQRVNAVSHNTDYGNPLTGNHQGAARSGGAAAIDSRSAEFRSLRIAGCAAPAARLTKREFILSNCLQPASQQRLYRAPAVPSLRSGLASNSLIRSASCTDVAAAQGAYGRPSRLARENRPVARSYGVQDA